MTPELRAAAARLRRHEHRVDAGHGIDPYSGIDDDVWDVVRDWLADNREDDDLPTYETWMHSVGVPHGIIYAITNDTKLAIDSRMLHERGAVRALCRALGVTLQEPNDASSHAN